MKFIKTRDVKNPERNVAENAGIDIYIPNKTPEFVEALLAKNPGFETNKELLNMGIRRSYIEDNIIESIKGTYDNIHLNQVEWYEEEVNRMNAENRRINEKAETVVTHAFFHIPLVEMLDGWNEFKENGYKDTEDFKFIEGIMGEVGKVVYCGLGEDDLFEKMRCNPDGTSVYELHQDYTEAADKNSAVLIERYPDGKYRQEIEISNEIAEYIGHENIYNFSSDFRMGAEYCAGLLDEFVQHAVLLREYVDFHSLK